MSDSDPFSALFHALSDNPLSAGQILFVGALPAAGLAALGRDAILVQPLQPYADSLKNQGWQVVSEIPQDREFDHVVMLTTKSHEETRHNMARAFMQLALGGTMIAAGANDAGGRRIDKDFVALDMAPVSDSKHKSRIVRASKGPGPMPPVAQEWISRGGWQPVLAGRFLSRPGLFGWDRVDQGSQLLAEMLPPELAGRGADFGCGYGFLSAHVMSACAGVTHLTALDADERAVIACRDNTKFAGDRIAHLWHDLTQKPPLDNLDFIVMNPPFHEGAVTQNQLGVAFIRQAASCLKPGGRLFMVANNHLPYEETLKGLFRDFHELGKDKGFKIIRASK